MTAMGQIARIFQRRNSAGRLTFSPDGQTLAAQTDSSDVLLWNLAYAEPPSRFAGPIGRALAFSAEGDSLIATGEESTVLFDIRTRLKIGTVPHGDFITSAAFSRDSRVMVSSPTRRNTLIRRDLDPLSWAKYACQAASRTLTRDEWTQLVDAESEYAPACARMAQAER